MDQPVLVVGAHPGGDDLECGATIVAGVQEAWAVATSLLDGVGTGRAASGSTPVYHRPSKLSRIDETRAWASRLPRHLSPSGC